MTKREFIEQGLLAQIASGGDVSPDIITGLGQCWDELEKQFPAPAQTAQISWAALRSKKDLPKPKYPTYPRGGGPK